jgi:hypothetical protein
LHTVLATLACIMHVNRLELQSHVLTQPGAQA